MSAPPQEAASIRPYKRSGTKEEVLTMLRKHVANGQPGTGETGEERIARKLQQREDAALWHANTLAGPQWQMCGPRQPTYVDERFRNFTGRYGHTRSD